MDELIVSKRPEGLEAVYREQTRVSYFHLFPGILLGCNRIKTGDLPLEPFLPLFRGEIVLRINFSLDGICEVRTVGGEFIYVKGGYLSISRDRSAKAFRYPTASYTGIEIYIQSDAMEEPPDNLALFGIDLGGLREHYLADRRTLLTNRWEALAPAVRAMQALMESGSPDVEQLRLYCLLVLRILSSGSLDISPIPVTALTMRQVECAKSAERLMTRDLSKRITVREAARQLNVGESSLKNWFRDVFGKSVSEYMRDLRIREAKRLLADSDCSIAHIANLVGYENQSKFTAMFQKYCGCTPSVFRKQ